MIKRSVIWFLSLSLTFLNGAALAEDLPQSTHPAWSWDGSKIAFINNRSGVEKGNPVNFEVFTMNADGSEVQQHTHNDAFEADLAWSRDQRFLAFKSFRDGNDEVYVLDIESGRQTNISNHEGSDGGPSFDVEGKHLYFWSDRDHKQGEIYSYNFESKSFRRLTDNNIREGSPALSPDGARIAFVSNHEGNDEIYVSDLNGAKLGRVTHNPLSDWYPRWSPDGRTLLSTYGDWETDSWEVRRVAVDASGHVTLVKCTDSGNASWHPRAQKIVFGSAMLGHGNLFVLDLEQGRLSQLTRPGGEKK